MREYQKEYEAYMKLITDAFITMNGDSINFSNWHRDTSVFYEVVWNEGINFSINFNCSLALTGMTYEEMKKWNYDISKKYLNANAITYDEWLMRNKYKTEKITVNDDKIKEGDFIIDTEKIGVSINGETLGIVVKCKKILDENTLIWESLDSKSSACDDIFQFKKVIKF